MTSVTAKIRLWFAVALTAWLGLRPSEAFANGRFPGADQLVVDVPSRPEPGQPVVREGGPGLLEDEDDHPGDQRQDDARQRAEQELGALVATVPRSRLLETETASHQCSGTQSVPMIEFAWLLWVTQPRNFFTPPTGAPLVTK